MSHDEPSAGPVQPYRSVKAALVPMVKSLAIDMAPKGVRVNMVSPGSIPPQEVAACVVFLNFLVDGTITTRVPY